MAQHDYVIENQSAPASRADINAALQAIVTTNSGTAAPATPYANMLWYDTTNDQIKIRNESNSAWITLGTVDQTNNVFNPNFLPATQAEAEAGTNNTKDMTPLRVKQAVVAQASAALASSAIGSIGTLSFALANNTTVYNFGSTIAGSLLLPSSASIIDSGPATLRKAGTDSALTGTWRCLGSRFTVSGASGSEIFYVTLWQRIL